VWRWVTLAVTGLWLGGSAVLLPPEVKGDAGEYLLMTESLFRHFSPEVRTTDVRGLATSGAPINFADVFRGYYEGLDGRRYCYHFWGYSLAGLPARLLLQLLHLDRLRALPLTNAALLFWALWALLRSPALDGVARTALFAVSLLSPAVFFVRWPHPEVFSFVGVTLALLWTHEQRHARAILAAAIAAMQNPPLVFLVLALWAWAAWRAWRGSSLRSLAGPSLAVLPVGIPAIFYYWRFRTPSLLAREASRWDAVSLRKAFELFGDLNLGMLPYLPLTLALFAFALVAALARRRGLRVWALAALLASMALAASATPNWNHGTSGPSRYTIWMLPLVFFGLLSLREHWSDRLFRPAVALAVAVQAAVVLGRGGIRAGDDYLHHSYAARFVLRHAPALYNPSHEIFTSRTTHQVLHAKSPLEGPVVYRTEAGCRKAWARPEDLGALAAACGEPQPGAAAALRRGPPGGWGYVHW
jgi:hypothetical protein